MKKTNTLSKNDPNYLKIGKFKKKNVYDAQVDMGDQMQGYFLDLGKQVITDEQFINIGFNYALIKGLELSKTIKNKKK
ncbi:MAG: hypothetical protein EBR82_76225 [Caulobacteraceae bacterium]|nr:hypothetical protein [Caulobacteraceae bacterium]